MGRRYTDAERAALFWARVDRSGGPDACWPWLGCVNRNGHGQVKWVGRKTRYAHRVAWFLSTGEWPALLLLHRPVVCHNPACCNPSHLYEGSDRDNARDMALDGSRWQSARTHCPQGHPYDEANTYLWEGKRNCRACHAISRRARADETRDERNAYLRAWYAANRDEINARKRALRAAKKESERP